MLLTTPIFAIMKIGISVGDINGIGLEVILKTFSNPGMTELCTPIIYCGSKTLGFHKKVLNLNEFNYNGIKSADQAIPRKVNMVYTWEEDVEINLGEEAFAGLCSLASGHKISEMTEENPPRSGKRRRSMAQATPPCGPVAQRPVNRCGF